MASAAASSPAHTPDFTLDLGGERFDPVSGLPDFGLDVSPASGPGFRLIQFSGPIQRDWLRPVRADGVEIIQYIHPYTYIVWADEQQMATVAGLSAVRWTGPMLPPFKVQPHLRNLDPGLRPTMALISRHETQANIRHELTSMGALVYDITPVTRHLSVVHMDVPGDRYLRLADLPAVYTVQYIPPEVDSRGEMSNQSVVGHYDGNNTVFTGYADWLTDTGYDGAGVVVSIVDAGIRNTHQDLAGQFTPCVSGGGSPTSCTSANDGHGTHVAGAVAGTGASGITDSGGFLRGQGVAPGATLIEQRYNGFTGAGPGGMIPNGMLTIFRESALSGAVLTNNSWGPTGSPQGYDIPTQQIDIITRDALPEVAGNQSVLPVWSIMNGGGDAGGACAPSSVGSPDEAKNLFAVGSTKLQNTNGSQIPDIFDVSSNSGHGNACDGRRIPHIVAPGCYTDSSTATSDTSHSLAPYCGTSMASPVVSGAVSIFIERYRDLYDDATPSPALVKAAFTAVAHNLEGFRNANNGIMGHRPDRFQGYGRLDLDAVANPANQVLYFDQEHLFENTGETWSLSVGAADPSQPVHIMLAWTDAPGHGMGGTTPAWVNDLDLEAEAGGDVYHGNVIGADGWSEAGGDADEMNNLEGVFLGADQHGGDAVNITVRASNISADALNPHDPGEPSQDFALVCYNCIIGDPTFALSVSPSSTLQCRPDAGSDSVEATVNVNPVGPYTGSVDLSVDSAPALVGADVDPDSVSVPGSSTLTVTFENGSDPGQIVIAGDDGTDQRTTVFTLNLEDPLATGPGLIAPTDEASGVGLIPTFSWDAVSGVTGYRFQLSTDPGFGTVVVDDMLTDTSFTVPAPLNSGTTYYWRVAGINICGEGPFDDVFSFDTAELADPPMLVFITSPGDADPGQTLDPVIVQIQDSEGEVVNDDNSTQITLSLASNPGGATLTGTLTRTVSAGEAVFDDLSLTAPGSSYTLRAEISEALDEVLVISDFALTASQTDNQTVLAGVLNRGKVTGFRFDGTVAGISGNDTWASDMRMDIDGPSGSSFAVGGFGTLAAPDVWDFGGSGSAGDGTYTSTHMDIFDSLDGGTLDAGDWAIQFQNAYASSTATMAWSDVTVTLHKLLELEAESDPFNVEGGLPAAEISPGSLAATLEPDQMTVLPLTIANTGDKADLVWSIETAEVDSGQQTVPPYDVPVGAARGMPAPDDQRVAPGVALPVIQGGPIDADFAEGFDDISTLPASGWALINNSSPPGANDWFQGTETFDAQAGPPTSYIVSNFQVVGGAGTASNWLLTPEVVLRNGTTMTFWTRAGENPDIGGPSNFPDRLEVRLSTAGASTDVGATATSVGDFTELLLVINEELNVGGYPIVWTQYTLEVTGLAEETSGRFALRYFITDSGPDGNNGNFVGIDTVGITQPEVIEPCDTPGAIPWLSVDPDSGTTPAGDSSLVDVLFDATGLPQGVYEAALCVSTNDPLNPQITVPVNLNVASDGIFRDCFEEDGACN